MLPIIDRVGRRMLLLVGAVSCMIVHFVIAGVMASKGHPVPEVNGNTNLTWEIKGSAGMTVIAFSYIFTGIYGFTWVCPSPSMPMKKVHPTNPMNSIGASSMDLRIRSLPPKIPRQGRWPLRLRKLDLQLRPSLLRRTGIPQHPVEDIHHLRCVLLRDDIPRFLHVPRDCGSVLGGD